MPITTPLTELLRIKHPILSAPMDTIAGTRLTRAVSEAGGFGILGGGYGDRARLQAEAAELKGFAPFGIGFITWSLAKQPELLDIALDARPQAIMLSFGDPAPFALRIKASGVRLICQVQSEDMAKQALDAGAEILIAQGTEAGGHGASRTTVDIVPAIVDLAARRVPVVAAGGIADGRGLAAMMMLGASGVLIGTRFYASVEANGAEKAKQRIRDADGNETVRGVIADWSRELFWPAPFTARTLVNDHIKRWTGREVELMQRASEVAVEYAAAKAAGNFEVAAVFAGEAVGLIHDIPPAAEIVERIAVEAEQLLEGKRNSVTDAFSSSLVGEGGAQRRMRGFVRGE
ncbi:MULTISPECIES: NAD(P)H-dependent flavin oxidoreductase [Bradyrhizobium]|uniref:2-nitropropane dioxygenase-like enzyme n=1 Tax=Bradyrhizobium vignae TaxID=1549949 RepID=A0A2U3Q0M7_9BRAD|nr:nitronate monooxygenase [Bradyrhizobium vignae]MBP0116346.1 nitronate monooxygenase [Bradyrhizobium vignae]RXH04663.1 nitronate monooxygenase [Bradyrhizobium vignae]SPP94973.1 2-nitropropane dioxygenase-like enzyme [Bradyrhizobium vignae]